MPVHFAPRFERSARALRSTNPLCLSGTERHLGVGTRVPESLDGLLLALERAGEAGRLSHQAFFQYVAADIGLPWMRMVERRCGIPRGVFSFLGEGRETCRNRLEEALDAIDAMVEDPTALPALRDHLRDVVRRFDRVCEEASRVGAVGELRVSAA